MVMSPTAASSRTVPVNNNTLFKITATLGRCTAADSVQVNVAPYPVVKAGDDISICYSSKGQLNGYIVADAFHWSPTSSMQHNQSLQPLVAPTNTTAYVLTGSFKEGCTKAVRDTVLVTVMPRVKAFAGNDTAIVMNQPLQLQASGGQVYSWFPTTGLSNPAINNPVVSFPAGVDTLRYSLKVTDAAGCSATDDIVISRFKTGTNVFVPSAFTPNKDGKNDVIRPILAGIKQLNFFRVYNRWGNIIYQTSEHGKGWDGLVNGQAQNAGTYVYVLQAIDFTGVPVQQKGTFVLLR
jgi:gliding motility-associated-like protein